MHYRLFQKTDIPPLVEIANTISAQHNDPARVSEASMEQMFAAPHIHPEADFWTVLNDQQQVIAGSFMMLRPPGMIFADVLVHPDYQAEYVVSELVQRNEMTGLARAESDAPVVYIMYGMHDKKAYVRSVLEKMGYAEVRRSYVMRMALDQPIQRPTFPLGYDLRPFDKERHGQAVFDVFMESFAAHWGGVTHVKYEQWAHQFADPDFDPTLFYILYHNDAIAAICLCERSQREENLGLVEILGVLPAHRKQGLGGLLLRHAFHEFQQRGYQTVGLDVDAQNTTNAVALYEKAGMSIYRCSVFYRKVLRGNPEDIQD